MKTKVIARVYRLIQAKNSCIISKNFEWVEKHKNVLSEIAEKYLPHGSGINSGCKIDLQKSNENKIVITFGFHHMDKNGFYCGWTSHKLICRPSFDGIDLKITGRDKNGIKEYLYEIFDYSLNNEIEF